MSAKENLYQTPFLPLRLPGQPLLDVYSGFLEWPASILMPDRVIKWKELFYRWEIELQIIATDSALGNQYLVGNPTKYNFGNYSLSTKNRVRHFDQLSFEEQYLCGDSRTIQLPGSANNRFPNYGVKGLARGRFVNQTTQRFCLGQEGNTGPGLPANAGSYVRVLPFQIGLGIDDIDIVMQPLQSSVANNIPIIVSPEQEDEIDKFAYFLYSGVDGLVRLTISISDELESLDYGGDRVFSPAATEPFPTCSPGLPPPPPV